MKPTLYIMVGLPGSGKTTKAKQLENEYNAIRFTPDHWHLELFGDDLGHCDHDKRHSTIERIMWELAKKLLAKGISVILDYGLWAREEREFFYREAIRLDTYFQVYYMDIVKDELLKRLEKRNKNEGELSFTILPSHIDKWFEVFQPVTFQEFRDYSNLLPQSEVDI